MRHQLTRRFSFSASHKLENPAFDEERNQATYGECRHVHGHNYRLEVTVAGHVDPAVGFFCNVLDFKAVVERLVVIPSDHRYLNEVPLFAGIVTTMENLSSRIWAELEGPLAEQGMELVEVLLAETDDNLVRLRKDT